MTTTDALTIAKPAGVALASLPEYLRNKVGNQAGLENVGQEDVLIPRLCIAQAMSPEVTKGDPKHIKGLLPGEFFNSVTQEKYGERVIVVPLFFFHQFLEFIPKEQGGGVAASYSRREDVPAGDLDFKDGEKPVVTEFKNEMCLRIDPQTGAMTPVVVSFKSSGLKMAKKWNSLMRGTNLPAYARSYVLEITTEKNTKGTWYGANVTPDTFVPESFFAAAEKYFNDLRQSGVKVDTTGLGEEAGIPEDADVKF